MTGSRLICAEKLSIQPRMLSAGIILVTGCGGRVDPDCLYLRDVRTRGTTEKTILVLCPNAWDRWSRGCVCRTASRRLQNCSGKWMQSLLSFAAMAPGKVSIPGWILRLGLIIGSTLMRLTKLPSARFARIFLLLGGLKALQADEKPFLSVSITKKRQGTLDIHGVYTS